MNSACRHMTRIHAKRIAAPTPRAKCSSGLTRCEKMGSAIHALSILSPMVSGRTPPSSQPASPARAARLAQSTPTCVRLSVPRSLRLLYPSWFTRPATCSQGVQWTTVREKGAAGGGGAAPRAAAAQRRPATLTRPGGVVAGGFIPPFMGGGGVRHTASTPPAARGA